MTVIDLVDQAGALDAADPLAEFRDQFVGSADPEIIAYLDGNSLGRPLRATRDRFSHFVEQNWGSRLIRAWDEGWMDDRYASVTRLVAWCWERHPVRQWSGIPPA
jgi:kynureninase